AAPLLSAARRRPPRCRARSRVRGGTMRGGGGRRGPVPARGSAARPCAPLARPSTSRIGRRGARSPGRGPLADTVRGRGRGFVRNRRRPRRRTRPPPRGSRRHRARHRGSAVERAGGRRFRRATPQPRPCLGGEGGAGERRAGADADRPATPRPHPGGGGRRRHPAARGAAHRRREV
ncbi:MAG: hypothetical protein AVDCRST_MAG08-2040, partial [uncultured Acetobacteraceae bacterium]